MSSLYWSRYLFLGMLGIVTSCFVAAFLIGVIRDRGKHSKRN